MWNVKAYEKGSYCVGDVVLIETLWNVKESVWNEINGKAQVLIETLWNVKLLTPVQLRLNYKSINRNIVECKAIKQETG